MRFKSNLETYTEHLDLRCEYEPHILPNIKIGTAKDYGKNYKNIRSSVVRHLFRNCSKAAFIRDQCGSVPFRTDSLWHRLA